MTKKAPGGLSAGGRSLWKSITDVHDLDAPQLVQLTEACRMKDRLDEMDRIIHGEGVLELMRFRLTGLDDEATVVVRFDAVVDRANSTANTMKQLLAALRLPDADTGRKPQRRGPRGVQAPSIPGGSNVSSMDRARAAKSG